MTRRALVPFILLFTFFVGACTSGSVQISDPSGEVPSKNIEFSALGEFLRSHGYEAWMVGAEPAPSGVITPSIQAGLVGGSNACTHCGDLNGDELIDVDDINLLVGEIFEGEPLNESARLCADVNLDSTINVQDIVQMVDYLFRSGPALCPSNSGENPTPPEISEIRVVNITSSSASIHFKTNIASFARIQYGPESPSLSTAETVEAKLDHSIALPALMPDTRYQFRVVARTSTSSSVSPSASFTTLEGVGSTIQFVTVENCSQTANPSICVPVSSCDDANGAKLNQSDRYYLLVGDIVASGTCFTPRAERFTLDLNGKTLRYAQAGSGSALFIDGGRGGTVAAPMEVKNGRIIGGFQETSPAVFTTGNNNNLKFHHLEVYAAGLQTEGILIDYGTNTQIYENVISLDSIKADRCSHYNGHIRGIAMDGRGGQNIIRHNRILGKGMGGISVNSCGRWDPSTPMLIHDNYIRMRSPINDGYAIAIGGNGNPCSDGTQMFNNTIDQINGRGIMIGGLNVNSDWGPGNIEIFNNYVSVQEGTDCEGGAHPGTSMGIRARFGVHDLFIHHNTFVGKAGLDVGDTDSDLPRLGGHAYGMVISSSPPYGVNNVIEDNIVDVHTTSPERDALGIYVGGGDNTSKTLLSYYRRNRIISNHIGFTTGGNGVNRANSDAGYNVEFENNVIVRGPSPFNFREIVLGFWYWGSTGIHLIDTLGEDGADPHNIMFSGGSGGVFSDINIQWTLNVRVRTANGEPADGQVQILSRGVPLSPTGTTTGGLFTRRVIENSYAGIDTNVPATSHNPYAVIVTANGQTMRADNLMITRPTDITCTVGAQCVVSN